MKLLFLPHCLKKEYIKKLKEEGEKRNYSVHVVGGSSAVKKILKETKSIDRIVGVACSDELELAEKYTQALKEREIKIIPVQLLTDGCKDTKVNLDEVINVLK